VKISTTLQPLIDTSRRSIPSLLQQLKVGQQLPAKVLEQVQPGLLRLQLASSILLARSQVALKAGTQLKLEVVKPFPVPELKILRELTRQEVREQVVRNALPRELPPSETRRLTALMAERAANGRLDNLFKQFVNIQRDAGISVNRLSPSQVQRAVTSSGVLHEARLVSGQPLDSGDGKFRLLQLLGQLQGLLGAGKPPTQMRAEKSDATLPQGQRLDAGDSLILRLLRLVEGSVSRVQLHQATALPQEDGQRQAWQLDLPLRLGDDTQDAMLRIEREAAHEPAGGESTWAVNLAFKFDTIGTLQCRIALNGERLSATFWCEQPTTQARLEQRLPGLQSALEAQGFEVVHLAGVLGAPPEPLIAVPMPDSLLDERA
jgi:hypothetical protein